MTRDEVKDLFKEIQFLYVFFKNTGSGMISSWERILKDTSFDDAMERLDEYSSDPSNTYPPSPGILASPKKDAWVPGLCLLDRSEMKFHVNLWNEIEDEEGRIYADPADPYRRYVATTED